jgi:PhnB protein
MATDTYKGMNGFFVSLVYPTAPEAKRVFDALTQGGKVTMPVGKSFWAEAFGMLVDRFGTPWMISGAMAPTP